jgi:N-acetylmuramoyl-L-alanine amidase
VKTRFTVHATGTAAGEDLTVRDLDVRDRKHGFAQIGYHYVITRDGKTHVGRDERLASIHEPSIFNAAKSVSVVLVGGGDGNGEPEDNFTPTQRIALHELRQRYATLERVDVHPSLNL